MAYYSFVVVAPQPIGIPKPMILLDAGLNAFSVVVDDLNALLEKFRDEGIEVQQMNRLDEFEPSNQSDLLIEGETRIPEMLLLPEVGLLEDPGEEP